MKLYKQQGVTGLYQILLPALSMRRMSQYFVADYGKLWVHHQAQNSTIYLQEDAMHAISKEFLAKGFTVPMRRKWKKVCALMIKKSWSIHQLTLEKLPLTTLHKHYKELYDLHEHMWSLSIFIDALDAGTDNQAINDLAKNYGLSGSETQTLLQPVTPSYLDVCEQAISAYAQGTLSKQELMKNCFWYGMDYSTFREFRVRPTIPYVMKDWRAEQAVILQYHGMKKNPLALFQELTTWRDERKKMNYVGLYGLLRILRLVLEKHNIAPDLAVNLTPKEASNVFNNIVPTEVLNERLHEEVFITFNVTDYDVCMGKQAIIAHERIKKHLVIGSDLRGQTASPGNASGIVRIIIDPRNATFAQGEILVTAMTRPEFVPLMKKAAAIITDEGGITSHAAIVSRELGIPCIVGTKHATTLLKDGEFVEVHADHALVRVVQKL